MEQQNETPEVAENKDEKHARDSVNFGLVFMGLLLAIAPASMGLLPLIAYVFTILFPLIFKRPEHPALKFSMIPLGIGIAALVYFAFDGTILDIQFIKPIE